MVRNILIIRKVLILVQWAFVSAWKRGDKEEREGVGGSGEKWPKQCMHV
jgi:hypothetical protein